MVTAIFSASVPLRPLLLVVFVVVPLLVELVDSVVVVLPDDLLEVVVVLVVGLVVSVGVEVPDDVLVVVVVFDVVVGVVVVIVVVGALRTGS